jgi:hypothetical protein
LLAGKWLEQMLYDWKKMMEMTKTPRWPLVLVLLFAPALALPRNLQAGVVPDGFLGVPWGATTEQVQKAMKDRGYRQLKAGSPAELIFRGAFAGRECNLQFSFLANSFYNATADACARSGHPAAAQVAFRQIVDDMTSKYGPPTKRGSDKVKTNDGKEHPAEGATWDLVDSKTSDKYKIQVGYGVTWFADDTGDQYVVTVYYQAPSLQERLKKAEY